MFEFREAEDVPEPLTLGVRLPDSSPDKEKRDDDLGSFFPNIFRKLVGAWLLTGWSELGMPWSESGIGVVRIGHSAGQNRATRLVRIGHKYCM